MIFLRSTAPTAAVNHNDAGEKLASPIGDSGIGRRRLEAGKVELQIFAASLAVNDVVLKEDAIRRLTVGGRQ